MSAAEVADLEPTFGAAVSAWLEELRRTGTPEVYILSGRRSNDEQWALRVQNCPDPANSPSGECSPPTAPVGASAHNRGEAVDIAPASAYAAAGALAGKYGLAATVGGEPWHFQLVDASRAPQGLVGSIGGAVGDVAGSVAGGLADAAGLGGLLRLPAEAVQVLATATDPGFWKRVAVGWAGVSLVVMAAFVLRGSTLLQAAQEAVPTPGGGSGGNN